MNCSKFTQLGFLFLLMTSVVGSEVFASSESLRNSRPNIIILLVDDAGFKDVGFNGSDIKTPNIDRLAKNGIILDRHYVYPVCSPTRAALLSGRPPSRFGVLGPLQIGSPRPFKADTILLPMVLKQAGYETAINGKWHLGLRDDEIPNLFGFDHSYGYLGPWLDSYSHLLTYVSGDQSGVRQWHRDGQLIDEIGHVTDLITTEAVSFIETKRDKTKPFFLYVPYSAPHTPIQEPRKYTDLYMDSIQNVSRRYFAAAMTHMDESIGEIVEALKQEGIEEETVVLFSSDNGAAIGRDYSGGGKGWLIPPVEFNMSYGPTDQLGDNSPLRGWKGSLYEGGIRVPAFISWPGRLKPGTCEEIIHICDWVPTLAVLAGAEVPDALKAEGMDVLPVFKGEMIQRDRFIYWRNSGQQAVRKGPWKLIHTGKTYGDGNFELFNLDEDPYEKSDRAGEHPDIVKAFGQEIERQIKGDLN